MAKRWYVIHTYSGYENKVKADLEHRIETFGLESAVVDIKIPTEEVTEIKSSRVTYSSVWNSMTTPGLLSAILQE